MTLLALPALRSDDPLGFLAALGLVEVCTTGLGLAAGLGWEGLGGGACLSVSEDLSVDDLAHRIVAMAAGWGTDQLVPPGPGFVAPPLSTDERRALKTAGEELPPLDPMRMRPPEAILAFAAQKEKELRHGDDDGGARWLAGLVCQLGRERGEERCELTPLYARTGQQNLHQLYRDYLEAVVSHPSRMAEALAGWRRVRGDSGANLDARALRDATVSTSGDPSNAAVPGATWLALMSAPFFRLGGDGVRPQAAGWLSARRGGRPRELFWPIWRMPLSRAALEVLLAHPVVRRAAQSNALPLSSRDRRALGALGVEAVLKSRRRTLSNSDGPLQTPQVMWP